MVIAVEKDRKLWESVSSMIMQVLEVCSFQREGNPLKMADHLCLVASSSRLVEKSRGAAM